MMVLQQRNYFIFTCLFFVSLTVNLHSQPLPWWDEYPLIVESPSLATVQSHHANVGMNASQNDPGWGLWGQKITELPALQTQFANAGLRQISYYETFGQSVAFICEMAPSNPLLDYEPIRSQHWGWQIYDGGAIRWSGIHTYFDDEEHARPYTRTHPRYGGPEVTYPDGSVATGYFAPAESPLQSRVMDACSSKDIFGNITHELGFNPTVNQIDGGTGLPVGPLDGLIYDPASGQYAGHISFSKDTACPYWLDYTYASTLYAADQGLEGMWTDNYSAWDNTGLQPVKVAFGEWSVARFRDFLVDHFTPDELAAMGVDAPESFDIRTYCLDFAAAFGDATILSDLNHRDWYHPLWKDDPLWRVYRIFKRQVGAEALSGYYNTVKQAAADAGAVADDFLIAGNDIPGFSLGYVRGDLDMVSTEMNAGWSLFGGPRGVMLPPEGGRYGPIYKLAREHARSRVVNVWYYLDDYETYLERPGLANAIYYEMLASNALPMIHPDNPRVVGTTSGDEDFFEFVDTIRDELGLRTEVARVGLLYSSDAILRELTPGGFAHHDLQPHQFEYLGWGTALENLHIPYRPLPQWKLTTETLNTLDVLIMPGIDTLDPALLQAPLKPWLAAGGKLIASGDNGLYQGEEGYFAPVAGPGALDVLLSETESPTLTATWEFHNDLEGWEDRAADIWGARGMSIEHSTEGDGQLVCRFEADGADYASGDTFRPRFFTFDPPEDLRGTHLQFRYRVDALPFNDPFSEPLWGRMDTAYAVRRGNVTTYSDAPLSPIIGEWSVATVACGDDTAPIDSIEITIAPINGWEHFPDGSTITIDWIRVTGDLEGLEFEFDQGTAAPWHQTFNQFFNFPNSRGFEGVHAAGGQLQAHYSSWNAGMNYYEPFLYNSDVHLDSRSAASQSLYLHVRARLHDGIFPTTSDQVVTLQWDQNGGLDGGITEMLPIDGNWHNLTFAISDHPDWGVGWRPLAGGWRLTFGGNESKWQLFTDLLSVDSIVFSHSPTPPARVQPAGTTQDPIGMAYYLKSTRVASDLAPFVALLDAVWPGSERLVHDAGGLSQDVGLHLYEDLATRRYYADFNNLALDLGSDLFLTQSMQACQLELPHWLRGRTLSHQALVPGATPVYGVNPFDHRRVLITFDALETYASIVLTALDDPEIALADADAQPLATSGASWLLPTTTEALAPLMYRLTVSNLGDATLYLDDLVLSGDFVFSAGGAPASVAAGSDASVIIERISDAPGSYTGTLTAETNDTDEPQLQLTITGEIIPNPPTGSHDWEQYR